MDEHEYYFTNLLNDGTNVDEFNTQSVGQISHSSPISPQISHSQSKKQKTKSGATPSSSLPSTSESVNIGDDSGGLERPTGRKAAKERARKSKSKLSEGDNSSSTYFVKLLEEMKEDKKKMEEKKVDFMEKMVDLEQEKVAVEQKKVAVEQEKVAVEQEKVQLEQMKEEQKIMLMDTSAMSPIQAEYFKRLQMEIMAKKM